MESKLKSLIVGKWQICRIFRVALLSALAFASTPVALAGAVFETEHGTGPDKWASVWLLTRFVDRSSVEVHSGSGLDASSFGRIPFDVDGSALARTGTRTTYETILAAYSIDARAAESVGTLVREIEIDAWKQEVSADSQHVESAFRRMQIGYGRDEVTRGCYLAFFDNVAAFATARSSGAERGGALIPDDGCMDEADETSRRVSPYVPLVDLTTAAMHASLGADVTFLDTREAWEYREGHIPGAINMPLREISEGSVEVLLDDDLVIAYCVKDFRGYEAAKRLRGLGVEAAIMKPYGMRGWIEAGLPVSGARGLPADEGMAAMRALARAAVESP